MEGEHKAQKVVDFRIVMQQRRKNRDLQVCVERAAKPSDAPAVPCIPLVVQGSSHINVCICMFIYVFGVCMYVYTYVYCVYTCMYMSFSFRR